MDNSQYCTILINSSPLHDCDMADEIFILSPYIGGCDRVQIFSGAALYLDILVLFGPVWYEIYSGSMLLEPK